jgi:hypothetical protein
LTSYYGIHRTSPDAANLASLVPKSTSNQQLLFTTGTQTIQGGGTRNFIPPAVAVNTEIGPYLSTQVDSYAGVGTFTLSYDSTTGDSFVGGGGREEPSLSIVTSATNRVTYNYTGPEPSAAVLLTSGLLGCYVFSRCGPIG